MTHNVMPWGHIAQIYTNTHQNLCPVLVFDSYYSSNASRQFLTDRGIKYIGAIRADRNKDILHSVDMLSKRGESSAAYDATTNELLVHHYDVHTDVGKKYIMTNALVKSKNVTTLSPVMTTTI